LMNKSQRSAGFLSEYLSSFSVSIPAERNPRVHPGVSVLSPPIISVSTCHDDQLCEVKPPSTFTVWKSSLFLNGTGFTVFDSSGNLVFRLDDYSSHSKHQLTLMDAAGNILLTMRRKRLSFNQRWDAFTGDGHGCGKAAFSVTKSAFRLCSSKPSARVVLNPIKGHNTKLCDYQMKGSLYKPSSSFTVLGRSGEIVAQATRKQATSEVMLGDDVLNLVVEHGIDETLVMGLLIIQSDMQK